MMRTVLLPVKSIFCRQCEIQLFRSVFFSLSDDGFHQRDTFIALAHTTHIHDSENKDLHEFPISISHYIVRTVAIKFATKLFVYSNRDDDDDDGNGGGVQLKQTAMAMATAARMNLHYVYIDIYA